MTKNIFLFTGENTFAIREERRTWIRRFMEKHGGENLRCLDAEGLTMRSLLDDISVAPFIAQKRLVIVDGIPKWKGEEVEMLLKQIHPQVILLFVSPAIDRRGAAAKLLLKEAQCQTFPVLKGPKLYVWIDGVAASHDATISRDARDQLLELVGMDQEMLFQEIQKLVLGSAGSGITVDDIDALVVPSREWVIWHLTDVIARGDAREALLYAQKLLIGGQDPFMLWNMLLKMIRNLTIIVVVMEEGSQRTQDIAEAHDIHPFVVQSLLPLARRMNCSRMRVLIDLVIEMDHALKTGAIRATADDATELHALIDQCVLAVSSVDQHQV